MVEKSEQFERTEENKKPRDAEIEIIHSRATRWMHWANFPLLVIMIWSGLRIYWADLRDPFAVGVGSADFTLFPTWLNEFLGLDTKLAAGMAYHFTFGWLFVINGLIFYIYAFKSGHWRELFPSRGALKNAAIVVLHDMYIWRKPLPEQGKYNAAQQITYSFILLLGAVAVVSGFAIYKPTQLSLLTTMLGGYEFARAIHFAVTIIFILFFFLHIVQVARAGYGNFEAMLVGYNRRALLTKAAADGHADSASLEAIDAELIGKSRRSLLVGAAAFLVAGGAWKAMRSTESQRIPTLLRAGHEINESIWRRLFRGKHLAPTYDRSEASQIRVNGRHGVRNEVDLTRWELRVLGPDGSQLGVETMDDIIGLERTEMTVEHKCVEGWSHIVTWSGVQFSTWVKKYEEQLGGSLPAYVNLATPPLVAGEQEDRDYYVSLDIESMMHPQTMLTHELNGAALTSEHGAPLRLTTPLKYGIKQIKRIGTIEFSDTKGPDYWEERGYDWYAHL